MFSTELMTKWLIDCETLNVSLENVEGPQPATTHTQNLATSPEWKTLTEQLEILYQKLIHYNQTTNITRLTEPDDFLYRHILDSLLGLRFIPQGASVLDVGSGAGFPAFPLALANLSLSVTALEATGKKCQFITQALQDLKLSKRMTVIQGRAEALAHDKRYRGKFDVVTARALSSLPTLIELTLPFVKQGGKLLAFKGKNFEAELEASTDGLIDLGGELVQIFHADSLGDGLSPKIEGAVLLVFQKVDTTPTKYPREYALIRKKPL
jgi:16S rRNA (guanine527-N7)-methyltransferase